MQAGHLIHHILTQILVPSAAGLKGLAEKCFSVQLSVCTEKLYRSSGREIVMGFWVDLRSITI